MSAQNTRNLTNLFSPKSIAVIGASEKPNKIGHITFKNILHSDYKGVVYPVNKSSQKILGVSCYQTIADLPEVVDLAIICVPSGSVSDVLIELGEKGVRNVVVFSAGFKEVDEKGATLEKELITTAEKYKLNILGPNCLGFANQTIDLNATFARVSPGLGNLRFVTQSGALASSIFDWISNEKLGFEEFVTLGNKAVISENDVLKYWYESESHSIKPILMYLESFTNGAKFLDQVSDLIETTPIILLKPGKSEESKKAMMSHTGSLAGEDLVLETLLKDNGIVRCEGIQDFFDFAKAFSWCGPLEGPNVAVVSNAGGPAVVSVDFIKENNLELAPLSEEVKDHLREVLPREASVFNPVDILGDALAERYESALEGLLPQEGVNAVLVILTPQVMTQITETAEVIGNLSKKYNKPIICSFIGGSAFFEGKEILNKFQIPTYEFPERAVKSLAAMWQWKSFVKRPVSQLFAAETSIKPKRLPALNNVKDLYEMCEEFNISIPPSIVAPDFLTASNFAKEKGFPLVLKDASLEILHKTEEGTVTLNIDTLDTLENTFNGLKSKNVAEIIIQKQVKSEIELIIGAKTDSVFGKLLLFGAGGTFVELLKDSNIKSLSVSKEEIKSLVENSKIFPVLKGYRGHKGYDLEEIYKMLEGVASLMLTYPEIKEFEINPAILNSDGIWAVDAKIIL